MSGWAGGRQDDNGTAVEKKKATCTSYLSLAPSSSFRFLLIFLFFFHVLQINKEK
jgi:hypothetical protein